MIRENERHLRKANKCHIWWNKLYPEQDYKVRNCDHITEKYRSDVHQSCNVSCQLTNMMRVNFHNLRG